VNASSFALSLKGISPCTVVVASAPAVIAVACPPTWVIDEGQAVVPVTPLDGFNGVNVSAPVTSAELIAPHAQVFAALDFAN
jgi:hypothetical protein